MHKYHFLAADGTTLKCRGALFQVILETETLYQAFLTKQEWVSAPACVPELQTCS